MSINKPELTKSCFGVKGREKYGRRLKERVWINLIKFNNLIEERVVEFVG